MSTHSAHTELLGGISHLCADTVFQFESVVAKQKEVDLAEAGTVEEEGRRRAEMVRQAAEREGNAQLERTRAIEWSGKDIETAESELAAKKSPLLEAEQGVSSDNDNDNDDTIRSTTEDHIVSDTLTCIILSCHTLYQATTKKKSKRQLEEETRASLGQVIHPTVMFPSE